ncbi:MAG: alpha/beta hydrolase [Burkholderiaceae bacterium]|nr:alpha/beta hydrolase [Burkholderiaceae bacterium]
MRPASVLVLPGWQGSGPAHWQSRWQVRHGYTRVEQSDWQRPLRGDWSARLEDAVLARGDADDGGGPILLAAHSLGCILAAWWAAHSRNAARVRAALLVAPPDIERADLCQQIPGWQPVARQRLPFAATVVASSNDPLCDIAVAARLAHDWGANWFNAGACGHINAESGLGDWPQGHQLLCAIARQNPPPDPA